jgi:hypothetical protein
MNLALSKGGMVPWSDQEAILADRVHRLLAAHVSTHRRGGPWDSVNAFSCLEACVESYATCHLESMKHSFPGPANHAKNDGAIPGHTPAPPERKVP